MPAEDIARIDDLIVGVRGQRVILAAALARIYGVETRVLNQAVKRNPEKFPADFVFQLTLEEAETVQRSRSQSVILKRGSNIKYLPYAFTEHGAIMAANVLNSPRAVQMSVFVVRLHTDAGDVGRYATARSQAGEVGGRVEGAPGRP